MDVPEEKICLLSLMGYSLAEIGSIYNISNRVITKIRADYGIKNYSHKVCEEAVILRPKIYKFVESRRYQDGQMRGIVHRSEIINFIDGEDDTLVDKIIGVKEKGTDGRFPNAVNAVMREYGYIPIFSGSKKFTHYQFDQEAYDARVAYEQKFFKRD
ncbi:MAG: hypothetical protein PHT97_14065 [Methanoculleus sp.]|uniref:hypothetical protein n=1 Tax=Methanoculleus sp. TaxID=90427 RepID=UPI002620E7BC|nr:hypothetical protein [Methanoculleus sp.]MDD2259336.1 hypothetical protein [Bacilli bacterium]MDD4472268.1 hypothetical protein [Methanoculleus sp.]